MAALPTGDDVAAFLGRLSDPDLIDICKIHAPLVAAFVKGYTRGRGFGPGTGEVAEELRYVIITATARLVVNPSQVERESADGYSVVGSFNGFSLPELAILHSYRRRTA